MFDTIKQLVSEIKIKPETSERIDFDKGFLIPLSLVGVVVSVVSIIINTFLEFSLVLYTIPIISLFFFIFIYYLGKNEKFVKPAKWFFIITVLLATNLVWYYNYGSHSYWIFLLVLLYSYLIFMMSGKQLLFISLVLLVNLSVLFIYEYLYPNALGNYTSNRARIVDSYAAMYLFGVSAYILMSLTKRYYLIEYAKAREADKLKSSFLSNLTHEIRTPLNAITGFSTILADEEHTREEKQHFKSIIESSSDSLLQLIDDVLDASYIEAGQLSLQMAEFCVSDLISRLETTYKKEALKTGKQSISISGEVSEEKVYAVSDKTRIHQIFVKLIDNALKFTDKGFVLFGYIEEENQLHFYVSDSGIGIEEEYQDKIFDRFYKVENQVNTLYRGAGLGLYLTQRNVELLSGSIWVESQAGAGSTFHFVIPVKGIRKEAANIVEDSLRAVKPANYFIPSLLIVEDDFGGMTLLTQMVSGSANKLFTAKKGKEAVDIFKENRDIAVVLLDIQLPDINGFEVIKQLRYINPDVIIIAQTAYVSEKDKHRCIEAGFDGYIAKPIDKRRLLNMIGKLLENRK